MVGRWGQLSCAGRIRALIIKAVFGWGWEILLGGSGM